MPFVIGLLHIALYAAFGLVMSISATAQSYPSRPIKIIVPYPPGGNADLIARIFAEPLGSILGATMVIDNRPGGGAVIGAEAAARSAPDGYTLLHATNSELTVVPAVRTLAYDPATNLAAISTTSKFPFMLVTRKDLPVKSLEELVALAKQQPGKLTFGSVGTGTANHLIIEPLKSHFKIDVLHVPYKGAGPVLTDLLGGHVDASFATVSSMLPQVRSGDLRALLVTSKERVPQLPDVPSAGELGLNELITENWTAFLAPAGTDPAILATLHSAITQAGKSAALIEAVRKAGVEPTISSAGEISSMLKSDLERWRRITKETGIKIE